MQLSYEILKSRLPELKVVECLLFLESFDKDIIEGMEVQFVWTWRHGIKADMYPNSLFVGRTTTIYVPEMVDDGQIHAAMRFAFGMAKTITKSIRIARGNVNIIGDRQLTEATPGYHIDQSVQYSDSINRGEAEKTHQKTVCDPELREKVADLCHQQWSHWMEYLFRTKHTSPGFGRS